MQIPNTVSSRELRALRQPGDTHAVRVILTKVSNSGAYRHRCRRRTYIFERDNAVQAHTIYVPMSAWMDGCPTGPYRDNPSISHDLQPTAANGLIIHIVPLEGMEQAFAPHAAQPAADPSEKLDLIGTLLRAISAPEIMHEALQIARNGDVTDLRAFVESIEVMPESEDPEEPERARNEDGTFVADDPATPETNEAWKQPETPDSSAFTDKERDDLENMHWKTFEKEYGMKKEAFRAARAAQPESIV